MTYIDIREVWIEAAFREVSLENIHIGDPVEIVLDLYPGRVFAGRVSAVGYGVGNRDVDPRTGLPAPRSQSGWIRPPQPMPVLNGGLMQRPPGDLAEVSGSADVTGTVRGAVVAPGATPFIFAGPSEPTRRPAICVPCRSRRVGSSGLGRGLVLRVLPTTS